MALNTATEYKQGQPPWLVPCVHLDKRILSFILHHFFLLPSPQHSHHPNCVLSMAPTPQKSNPPNIPSPTAQIPCFRSSQSTSEPMPYSWSLSFKSFPWVMASSCRTEMEGSTELWPRHLQAPPLSLPCFCPSAGCTDTVHSVTQFSSCVFSVCGLMGSLY